MTKWAIPEQTFIHYGDAEFKKEAFKPVKNRPNFNKPYGGLWASPVDSEKSWKNFLESEQWRLDDLKTSFKFSLREDARVLRLNLDNIREVPKKKWAEDFPMWMQMGYFDFEKLAEQYDAMLVMISEIPELNGILMGWDADSLLVFNPDAVEPKE